MSGRDRRHFSRELHKGEQEHARLVREAEAAYAAADRQLADAHRLDCLAWSARLFIGGPDAPSPTIADALHGDTHLSAFVAQSRAARIINALQESELSSTR